MTLDEGGVPVSARRFGWPEMVLALLFAALFGYFLYAGIFYLQQVPLSYEYQRRLSGVDLPTPWAVLILDVVAPVALYVGAVLVGRRRGLGERALVFIVGLAAVSAIQTGLESWARFALTW